MLDVFRGTQHGFPLLSIEVAKKKARDLANQFLLDIKDISKNSSIDEEQCEMEGALAIEIVEQCLPSKMNSRLKEAWDFLRSFVFDHKG